MIGVQLGHVVTLGAGCYTVTTCPEYTVTTYPVLTHERKLSNAKDPVAVAISRFDTLFSMHM